MILEILDLLQILFNNFHFQFWVKMGPVVTVVAGNIYCPTLMYLGAHNLFHFSITVTLISVGLFFLPYIFYNDLFTKSCSVIYGRVF